MRDIDTVLANEINPRIERLKKFVDADLYKGILNNVNRLVDYAKSDNEKIRTRSIEELTKLVKQIEQLKTQEISGSTENKEAYKKALDSIVMLVRQEIPSIKAEKQKEPKVEAKEKHPNTFQNVSKQKGEAEAKAAEEAKAQAKAVEEAKAQAKAVEEAKAQAKAAEEAKAQAKAAEEAKAQAKAAEEAKEKTETKVKAELSSTGLPVFTASQPSFAERRKVEAKGEYPLSQKVSKPKAEAGAKEKAEAKAKEQAEAKAKEQADAKAKEQADAIAKEAEAKKKAEEQKQEPLISVRTPTPAPKVAVVHTDARPAPVTIGAQRHHIEPVVANDKGSINDLLNKLKTTTADGTEIDNKEYMAQFHIKKFDPKVIGDDGYLTLEMYCDKDPSPPGAGMPAVDESSRKTVNVYAQPDKGAVKYSLDKPTTNSADDNNRAIERVCRLAVDAAKPGTTFKIPAGSPDEAVVKRSLEKALSEKYPTTFKKETGKLMVPIETTTEIFVAHEKHDLGRQR